MTARPSISTCLWFDFEAEKAVSFYLSVFADARVTATARYGDHGPGPAGAVMTIAFEIGAQPILALNGGPQFPFTPAVSLIVDCHDQAEIDRYWARLSEGGKPGRCGWLTDRFGLSWQIVPRAMAQWMTSGEKNAARVMNAVLSMDKLDIAELELAYGPREEASMSEQNAQDTKGKFVWYEYMGDDLAEASAFYADVVGWSLADNDMAGFPYKVASVAGHGVAGMMTIAPEAKALGAPACWTGYLWVFDVDAECEKLTAAGGRVIRPGSDIPSVGRFAVVTDPQGATFMLFRDAGGNPPPPPPPGTAGLVGWHELATTDAAAALNFYSQTFGWKKDSEFDMGPMGAYHLFSTGHGEFGGIFTKAPQMPGPFWLYYFNVDAIDAGIERLSAKGGKVVNGPMEVPGGLWIVQATDPQGAFFALVAPKR